MRTSLPSAIIRFGFFLVFVLYGLFVGFKGGFHQHPVLRGVLIVWAAAAVLTYFVDMAKWRSRAS